MKFRKKPVVVEAITFAELVEYGRANGANIVNGMPWSFKYEGHPVTHENDACYLIFSAGTTIRVCPEDMLVTGVNGGLFACSRERFAATYEPASRSAPKLVRVPLGPDDIPPVCWLRRRTSPADAYLVTGVDSVGINEGEAGMSFLEMLGDGIEYSADRKTWLPCWKEIAQ